MGEGPRKVGGMSLSFVTFARAHGVVIEPARLFAGDRIRRCPTVDHPKKENGAYFWDGQRGWVFNWEAEASVQWWHDANARPWTEAEKQEWKRKRESAKTAQQQQYARSAKQAEALIAQASPDHHSYLEIKGFKDAKGLVLPDGVLIVPMRNVVTNKLQGVQTIRWITEQVRHEKKMLFGMQARNAVLRLGPKTANETILCEGYATGLSLEVAARQMRLNAAVLVCFSDRNLVNVATQVRGKKYAYADNDESGAGERAAIDAGVAYCMSDTPGYDANDNHKRNGLMTVCKKLMEVRRRA